MGGCGSCGPKPEPLTNDRLEDVWGAVRAELEEGRSPAHMLRHRFLADIDASMLDDAGAESAARLWHVWGAFEAIEALHDGSPERAARFASAASVLEGALAFRPTPASEGRVRHDLGAAYVARSLLATGTSGIAGLFPARYSVRADATAIAAWDKATPYLTAVVDADGSDAIRESATRLLGLVYTLRGVLGTSEKVRARLLALDNALATLREGDPLRRLAAEARQSLGGAGLVARVFGRYEQPLPQASGLQLVDLQALFCLPAGVGMALQAPAEVARLASTAA